MTIEQIKREYIRKECDTIQAIEMLQDCAMSSHEAEQMVHSWEKPKNPEPEYKTGNNKYPREEDDENNEESA